MKWCGDRVAQLGSDHGGYAVVGIEIRVHLLSIGTYTILARKISLACWSSFRDPGADLLDFQAFVFVQTLKSTDVAEPQDFYRRITSTSFWHNLKFSSNSHLRICERGM